MRQPAVYRLRLIVGGEYGQQKHSFKPKVAVAPFVLEPALGALVFAAALGRRFALASFHIPRAQVRAQSPAGSAHRDASHAFRKTSGEKPQAGNRHRIEQGAAERRESPSPAQAVEITIGGYTKWQPEGPGVVVRGVPAALVPSAPAAPVRDVPAAVVPSVPAPLVRGAAARAAAVLPAAVRGAAADAPAAVPASARREAPAVPAPAAGAVAAMGESKGRKQPENDAADRTTPAGKGES